jgi:hypothetical protein
LPAAACTPIDPAPPYDVSASADNEVDALRSRLAALDPPPALDGVTFGGKDGAQEHLPEAGAVGPDLDDLQARLDALKRGL